MLKTRKIFGYQIQDGTKSKKIKKVISIASSKRTVGFKIKDLPFLRGAGRCDHYEMCSFTLAYGT